MEVAASLPNGLKVFPLRIMAREDFPPLQQVAFHSETSAKDAAEEIEEGEILWCSLKEDHGSCKDQQYSGAVPFLAKSSSTLSCRPSSLAIDSCHPCSQSSAATPAPRLPPPAILAHDVQLERSVDALLSSLDKFSSLGQSGKHIEQVSLHSPTRSKWLPFKGSEGSSPSKQAKFFSSVSPRNPSQSAVASPPLCSASFISKKPQVLSPRAKQSSVSPKAERDLKSSPSLKTSTPQVSHPGVLPSAGYNSSINLPFKQSVDGCPQPYTRAFSPRHCAQASSLSNNLVGTALQQKHQVPVESTYVRLSPQTSLPVMTQGHEKRAFVTCASGNKRPRSSAVRDYPEGCGKNLHLKLDGELSKPRMCHDKACSEMQSVKDDIQPDHGLTFPIKQFKKAQNLGSSQVVNLQYPVQMMEDMAALCLYKPPKAQKLLSLKRKHDARSQELKKSKVRHSISCFLRPVKATFPPTILQETTSPIEWLPDNHFDHATLAERALNLQVPKRSRGRPKGVKFAKKSLMLSEEVDKLLPAEVNGVVSARSLVKRTLQEFDCVRRSLAMSKDRHQRPDLAAATILKEKGRWRNCGVEKIIGDVPGVEVGDQFSFRIEMLVIGLHRQVQGGIDFISGTVRPEGPLATSIVASGGYEDDDDYGDTFIYTGQGGNNYKGDRRQACNQVLKRGNLALSNSFKEKTPVRVIRGSTDDKFYTYDGLYDVIDCWFQTGASGFGVYQYKLTRRPGQPELGSSIVRFVGSVKQRGLVRPHLLLADISNGKETRPICVVNELDEEMAPNHFNYVHKMRYPNWYRPEMAKGCDCVGGCVDASKCLCAAKNGGEFPYNEFGQIVREKNMVFECGKFCACSGSCHNRVSQRGPKHQLEVFKTSTRGWGVRSLEPIRPGDFICEYVGELLSDVDAEQRIEQDEYLFDIGNKTSAWSVVSELMGVTTEKSIVPAFEDVGYTIDARLYGSVARFINHSCSPNLFTQNVFYDSDDLRFPHVTLFSMENIPPMRELSYDYNYTIGHVRDANGNVKSKNCYCSAQDCRGRLY